MASPGETPNWPGIFDVEWNRTRVFSRTLVLNNRLASNNQATPVQVDNLSLSTESNTVNEGTTQYKVANTETALSLPLSLPLQYQSSYFPNDVTAIAAYLSKPVPVASGSWTILQTAGTLIFNQDAWTGIYNNIMWREKLHGYLGLRATLRVDLILNATPFHQGRLRVCYYPVASMNPIKAAMHIGHRIPLSQLPGIDIGCGDASVSLSIPYVAPGRFIEMTSAGNVWSWGNIYVAVMSPLQVGPGGDDNVDYTIWYSLHDVELFGQTNKPVQQSAVGKSKSKRHMPTEQEQRPISYALGAASDFAGSIAKIPLLTPWAGPVSWFLNAAKGAAYAFGFAKPLNTEKPCLMSSNYNWYTTTSDGLDNSMPLSVLADAKLKILDDVSEGGQDQMSIEFIKRQWSFWSSFVVAESNTLGQQIARIGLTPWAFVASGGTHDFYYTPIGYLARLFGLYRGGVEIMFKFVKTGFHAGSLAVTYVPGPNDDPMSYTDTSYCYRTIIDLQEGDEACFRCPFLLPHDFFEMNITYGALYVHVVNPLRSPETCSDDFEVLTYVRGAESLQFQKPVTWAASPCTKQGGDVSNVSQDIVCSAPGDAPLAPLNIDFCQDSMSECVTSTLQLIKRFLNIAFEYTDYVNDTTVKVIPWVCGISRHFGGVFDPQRQCWDPNYAQVLAPFAFYRGGMRFRVTPISTGVDINTPYIARIDGISNNGIKFVETGSADTNIPYVTDYTGVFTNGQTLPCATNTFGFGGLSVQVPYQSIYRFCPVQFAHLGTSAGNFSTPRARLQIYTGASKNRLLTRAVADDFQALFWVGVPRFSA